MVSHVGTSGNFARLHIILVGKSYFVQPASKSSVWSLRDGLFRGLSDFVAAQSAPAHCNQQLETIICQDPRGGVCRCDHCVLAGARGANHGGRPCRRIRFHGDDDDDDEYAGPTTTK